MNYLSLCLFFIFIAYAHGACSSFATKCTYEIGKFFSSTPIKLDASKSHYLSFNVPSGQKDLDIDLTTLYGSLSVFAAIDREPTETNYDYTNSNDKNNNIKMVLNGSSATVVNVLIRADSGEAKFFGLTKVSTSPFTISSSLPYSISVPSKPQGQTIFSFNIPIKVKGTSSISLSSMGSEYPSIKLKLSSKEYTSNDGYIYFEATSSDIGKDALVTLTSSSSTSSVSSIFSFLFQEDIYKDTNSPSLALGIPIRDKVPRDLKSHYYIVEVPRGMNGKVKITLESLFGDVDLYVNPKDRGFFHREYALGDIDGDGDLDPDDPAVWSSSKPSGIDEVIIEEDDQYYSKNGDGYYISVYAFEAGEYSLRVSFDNSILTLAEGISYTDHVSKDSYNYYRIYDYNPTQELFIHLEPTVGDSDLYVSCQLSATGDDQGYPSKHYGHSNFSSSLNLEDALAISPTDRKSCVYLAKQLGPSVTPIYYIAVYGYTDSTYTLSYTHSGGYRQLVPGNIVTDTVYKRLYHKYRIRNNFESQGLYIRMTPLDGDCDLYVKRGKEASLEDYDYRSASEGVEDDFIYIPETEMCVDCFVYILVQSYATSKYNIVAYFTDSTLNLDNGVAIKGSVGDGKTQIYSYEPTADANVVVTLTIFSNSNNEFKEANEDDDLGHPYNSGVPSIFISTSNTPNITNSEATWDALVQSSRVPKIQLTNVRAFNTVYIGVGNGITDPNSGTVSDLHVNATYSIRVHETYYGIPTSQDKPQHTILSLNEGLPQSDEILSSTPMFYGISAPMGHETINIFSDITRGQIELYAKKCTKKSIYECAVEGVYPSNTNKDYTFTEDYNGNYKLSIERNDANYTQYIIGVYSNSPSSIYKMLYGFSSTTFDLQEGVPVVDKVVAGEFDYFRFYVPPGSTQVRFSLDAISGDPDFYVSTINHHPSIGNSTWRSLFMGSDVIKINITADSNSCTSCYYFIAVTSAIESTYTLTATFPPSLVTLYVNTPISSTITAGEWNSYIYTLNSFNREKDVSISLPTYSGNPEVYVTLDGSTPSLTNYQFLVDSSSTRNIFIPHTNNDFKTYCNNGCSIRISIYTSSLRSDYTILVSLGSFTPLMVGTNTHDSVASDQYKIYKTSITRSSNQQNSNIEYHVSIESGHVALYVKCVPDSTSSPKVDSTHYDWRLSMIQVSGNPLVITNSDLSSKNCDLSTSSLYASVFGQSASSYKIMVTFSDSNSDEITRLSDDYSIERNIQMRKIHYFMYRPSRIDQIIKFELASIIGDADLYISDNLDKKPTFVQGEVINARWSSKDTDYDYIEISKDVVANQCRTESTCYFLVAVAGASPQPATYSLGVSYINSITKLRQGEPIERTLTGNFNYDYYSFELYQINRDVVFSVTSTSGDPDIFVSVPPNKFPSRSNSTWSQAKYGNDYITIQYNELVEKGCVPNPLTHEPCLLSISVYSPRNCTYQITANVDDGFLSPTILTTQNSIHHQVKASRYNYYKFNIGSLSSNSILSSLVFTLTPDNGDVDLYVLFAPKDSEPLEPGRNNYSYKSAGWSSVVEKITVSPSMPGYCSDCIVFISVFGYEDSSYTLQATTNGLTRLSPDHSIGDHIDKDSFNYFIYTNYDRNARLKFTATVISGDVDLYIKLRSSSDPIPSKINYDWRSLSFGSDTINISYEDEKFCFDCDYIVGVYAYQNSSYTLSVQSHPDTVIKLTPNRPLNSELQMHGMDFYYLNVINTASDMKISLTSINTGSANMYVHVMNGTEYSRSTHDNIRFLKSSLEARGLEYHPSVLQGTIPHYLPNPTVRASYEFTTENTGNNFINLPGPLNEDDIILITVQANSAIKYSIIGSVSNRAIVLQNGVPQNHFLSAGQNELFLVYPPGKVDMRITLTARSGDPDMYVSNSFFNGTLDSSSRPYCVAGKYGWDISCSNYIWASRQFSTDQIIISADAPCTPVLPGTTIVNCNDATSYNPSSDRPLLINVYGYKDSKFTIMSVPTNQHITLLPGQPQQSSTNPAVICSKRSNYSGGACLANSEKKKTQISYFSFQVARQTTKTSLDLVSNLILSINPQCNITNHDSTKPIDNNNDDGRIATGDDDFYIDDERRALNSILSTSHCIPGCSCNPLTVYITSCPVSKCTESDRFPSSFSNNQTTASFVINGDDSSTSTITINNHNEFKNIYCDPEKNKDDCMYYISVVHQDLNNIGIFKITARTPNDLSLIPCEPASHYPDGIVLYSNEEISPPSKSRLFELCGYSSSSTSSSEKNSLAISSHKTPIYVELEQCFGQTSLYVCPDDQSCGSDFPTTSKWNYFADLSTQCINSNPRSKKSSPQCDPNTQFPGRVILPLPPRSSNYYILANGTGSFNLKVQQTNKNGELYSPHIGFTKISSGKNLDFFNNPLNALKIQAKTSGTTIKLKFRSARVHLPGGSDDFVPSLLTYKVYIFEDNIISKHFGKDFVNFLSSNSVVSCTPEAVRNKLLSLDVKDGVRIFNVPVTPVQHHQDYIEASVSSLKASNAFTLMVLATCDSSCLHQLSQSISSSQSTINCASGGECKPVSLIYQPFAVTSGQGTSSKTIDTSTDSNNSFNLNILTFIVAGLILTFIGIALYYFKGEETAILCNAIISLPFRCCAMLSDIIKPSRTTPRTTNFPASSYNPMSTTELGAHTWNGNINSSITTTNPSNFDTSGYVPPTESLLFSPGTTQGSGISSIFNSLRPKNNYDPLSTSSKHGSQFVVADDDDENGEVSL